MSKSKEELLTEVQTKVIRLIEMYENCREANSMLTVEIQELRVILDEKELKLKEMGDDYKNLKTARSLSETSENANDAKQKINKIVREIDNCIALLNH